MSPNDYEELMTMLLQRDKAIENLYTGMAELSKRIKDIEESLR